MALRANLPQEALALTRDERRLEALLHKAQQHVAALRLTLPLADNAWEAYRRVLEIGPHTQQAKEAMKAIADRYGDLARASAKDGDFEEGLRLVALGLRVAPKHSGLNALQIQIQDVLQAQPSASER